METLKEIVTTLTTALIFISAIELMAPKNKTKKYISFILGLILISIILNPIIKFISNGEKSMSNKIENYTAVFSKEEAKMNIDESNYFESNLDNNDSRKKAFVKNFNKNCDSLLQSKYKDMTFKSDIDCDIDFNNVSIDIKSLKIGIQDKSIKKIKKIQIGKDNESNNDNVNNEYSDIIEFVSTELKIPKEKIEVYKLE